MLKFKCIKCPAEDTCCKNRNIALTNSDVRRIATRTGKDPHEFVTFIEKKHPSGIIVKGKFKEGVLVLKLKEDGVCPFLRENLCKIYTDRPMACRLYPFNPIFVEKKGEKTKYNIGLKYDCPVIHKNIKYDNKVLKDALKWRKEVKDYGQLVAEWNFQPSHLRHLGRFLEWCKK